MTKRIFHPAWRMLQVVTLLTICSVASASVPLTDIGLLSELERSLVDRDRDALESLHDWTDVHGVQANHARARIDRLLSLDVYSVFIEPFEPEAAHPGLRFNVAPTGVATIAYRDLNGNLDRVQLPFGEQHGRLYLSSLVESVPVRNVVIPPQPPGLEIVVAVSDPLSAETVSYEVACVLETDSGEETLSYVGKGGSTRRVPGNRFKSCGMRLPGGDMSAVELLLTEGERLVYRSGQIAGAGTILYRPDT